ncbi:MAG TPA: radical SAM protein [Phycisphaerales bacterium]|nr:radical SAM protein [Phycisphaerales bacterium]HIO53125.1 radical SAM protein [Phycisphaerales bacterium]
MQRLTVKNVVTESKANGAFSESELTRNGIVEDHNIILTTNKECSFRCVMCDLWKNTLDYRVKDGAVAKQVKDALNSLPKAKHLKLYNAGSFFDRQSIPKPDTFEIADFIQEYETLIVEVHPKLISTPCFEFADYLQPQLEVAMGLETVDPDVLPRLNKSMTLDDFERATTALLERNIFVRAFILLRTPWQTEEEGIYWAKASIDFAQSIGVECCTVIPTRPGNGTVELTAPLPESLHEVVEYGIAKKNGRVFGDSWDLE